MLHPSAETNIVTIHSEYWQPEGVCRPLSQSAFYWVGLLNDGRTVLKYTKDRDEESLQCLRNESARYQLLSPNKHLVTHRGMSEDGLLLEYCEQGDLQEYLRLHSLTETQKLDLSKQVTDGLVYLHQHHYIHCDLHVRNVFLTSDLDAKIGDLQGQLYRPDGTIEWPAMSQENSKSRHPEAGEDEFTTQTDIFALGTLLYHLWHGHEPFSDLDESNPEHWDEIQGRYLRGEFPITTTDATNNHVDEIILRCWTSKFNNASEVARELITLSDDKLESAHRPAATDQIEATIHEHDEYPLVGSHSTMLDQPWRTVPESYSVAIDTGAGPL